MAKETHLKKQHKHTQWQPDILFNHLMLLAAAAGTKEQPLANARILYPYIGIIGRADYGHQLY